MDLRGHHILACLDLGALQAYKRFLIISLCLQLYFSFVISLFIYIIRPSLSLKQITIVFCTRATALKLGSLIFITCFIYERYLLSWDQVKGKLRIAEKEHLQKEIHDSKKGNPMWYTIRKCISRKEVSQPVFTEDMKVLAVRWFLHVSWHPCRRNSEILRDCKRLTLTDTSSYDRFCDWERDTSSYIPFPPVSFLGLTKFRWELERMQGSQ